MLRDQGFDDLDNLLLLTAGQLGHGFKHRARLAARLDGSPRCRFAEQHFHADAQCLCHRNQHIGAGKVAAAFPITQRWYADSPICRASSRTERPAVSRSSRNLDFSAMPSRINGQRKKCLHVVSILTISGQCK